MTELKGLLKGSVIALALLALPAYPASSLQKVQTTPAPGHFAGKFELVPLFTKGNRPVIRNGHQYDALRNAISFRRPNGELVTMPAGMQTDQGSIPRLAWPILPPDGPYGEATIPHDLCYSSVGAMTWHGHVGRSRAAPYTRPECDEILDEGMIALGVPQWKRVVIWSAVRVGGRGGFGH